MQIVTVTFTVITIYGDGVDVVNIYNGNSVTATLIASLTGSQSVPRSYTSTQKYMLVRFTSNASGQSVGFAASFISTSREFTFVLKTVEVNRLIVLNDPTRQCTGPVNEDDIE